MATQDKIVPQQPATRSDLKNFPLIHCKISNSNFEKKAQNLANDYCKNQINKSFAFLPTN